MTNITKIKPGEKVIINPQKILEENDLGIIYLSILTRMGYVVKKEKKGRDVIYTIPPPEERFGSAGHGTPRKKYFNIEDPLLLKAFKLLDGHAVSYTDETSIPITPVKEVVKKRRTLDHQELIEELKRHATFRDGHKYLINLSQLNRITGTSSTVFSTLTRHDLITPIPVTDQTRQRFQSWGIKIPQLTRIIYEITDKNASKETPTTAQPLYRQSTITPMKPRVFPTIPPPAPAITPTILPPSAPAAAPSGGVAVFVDLPNATANFPVVTRFLLEKTLETAQTYGPANLAFVLADLGRQSIQTRQEITGAGFIGVDCPGTQFGDGQYHECVDAVMADLIYRTWEAVPNIDTYVLVTGDSDFVPTINRLRMRKKKVILVYPTPKVATTLKRIVDDFIVLEQSDLKKTLNELAESLDNSTQLVEKTIGDAKKEFALKCLIDTTKMFNELLIQGKRVGISWIVDHIWSTQFQKDERLRYTDCSDLVLALKNAGIIRRVDDPSVTQTYYTLDWNHDFVRYWLKKGPMNGK